MNKYKRLLIFITMCLSLIMMFVYKYKYSNLSTLFELMQSIPGSISRSNKNLLELKEAMKIDFQKNEFIKGVPYWTEIFPRVFVYSTYWFSRMTRTLMFAKKVHPNDLKSLKCEHFYANAQNHSSSVINIVYIQNKEDELFFYLDCKPTVNNEIPQKLIVAYKNLTSSIMIPKSDKPFQTGHYAMCVKPLNNNFFDVYEILEFIIYHYHVGIKYFVFYEDGLTYEVRKLLMDVAFRDGIYIFVKPWNLPFYSRNNFDASEVAFLDCFHNVAINNQSSILFKSDISNFILPKNNYNLSHLIEDFGFPTKAFKFHEKVFCLEDKTDQIAANLNIPFTILLKYNALTQTNVTNAIAFDVQKVKEHILSYTSFQTKLENKLIHETNLISKGTVVVHSYKKCGAKSKREVEVDKSMWTYKNVLFKSHLYLLAKKFKLIFD